MKKADGFWANCSDGEHEGSDDGGASDLMESLDDGRTG